MPAKETFSIPPHGATPEGTRSYFAIHGKGMHADKIREFEGLTVSALALGTYLGNYDDETDTLYEGAVIEALSRGCNFIDTAINYRCQRSERSIGRALKNLITQKKVDRRQVVISTKGGFIPFESRPPQNLQEFIRKTWIESGIVSKDDIVASCHCLHPDFLQRQIHQSLENLQLDTVDIYYLHNPEMELAAVGPDLFYQRLERAFQLLEENVHQGRIQFYGLATWTGFREPQGVAEAISLARVLETAERAGGEGHHLKVIQLPYNLAMLEAVSVHSQSYKDKPYPVIPAASFQGIHVMTSAPLLQSQLLNLPASVTQQLPGGYSVAQKALQFVASTPSVTSAMVGMKSKGHIEDNLSILKKANWDLPTLQKICDVIVNQ